MSDDQLEIRYIPLDQAVLWDRNPKLHSIGDLDASFDRYGFKMPPRYEPHINGPGQGGIGAGNGRIKTLLMRRDQGRQPPRGIVVDPDRGWLVPILFGVDADSQAAAEAFGLDDNNLTLAGGPFTPFDMARMWGDGYTDILAGLAMADALPITVDGDALDGLLAGLVPPVEPGNGGDDFDTTPADGPTRCQPGDLWQIGPHRLLVGDCTDPANVARLMQGERAALCVTDPPYGVAFDGGNRPDKHSRQYDDLLQNDGDDLQTLEHFAQSTVFAIDLALREGAALYLFFPIVRYCIWRTAVESIAEMKAVPIWAKDNPAAGRSDFFWGYEPMFYAIKAGARHTWNGGRGQSDVWQFRNVNSFGYIKDDGTRNATNDAQIHRNQKPLDLIMHAIELSSNRDDIVIDFFLGSATTLIAGHRLGRRVFGCEVEPKYADVILRRAEAEGLTCERAE